MNALSIFKYLVGGLLLCVSMALTTSSLSQSSQVGNNPPDLYGVRFDGPRIRIDLVSYGQTAASDFSVQLEAASPDVYRLSIVRHKQDRGRVAAHVVALTLDVPTLPKLAQAKFILVNKL